MKKMECCIPPGTDSHGHFACRSTLGVWLIFAVVYAASLGTSNGDSRGRASCNRHTRQALESVLARASSRYQREFVT